MGYKELAEFYPAPQIRESVTIDQKIQESGELLKPWLSDTSIEIAVTPDNMRLGIIPRLSPYDIAHLPDNARLIKVPEDLKIKLSEERSYDLIRWNNPRRFLDRLKTSNIPFVQPVAGRSRVMDRLASEGKIVGFDNLRIDAPEPQNGRQSRSEVNNGLEINIMGQTRLPFVLGSVPDVGSFLSYVTMAQANGMSFVSRDKILSNVDQQALLIKDVISFLKSVDLPKELYPSEDNLSEFAYISNSVFCTTNDYLDALRNSWVSNVGAAIEASDLGIKRAEELHKAGCKLFRIYSPEGGREIIDTVLGLRDLFAGEDDVKIVGGQVMDASTALKVEDAGCDALFIGVAGGSQCTTSVNADIPVKTPNLLYDLRGKIKIPIGIEGGGVGTHIMTAFSLGASFLSKPGEIGVSWEGSGGEYIFSDNPTYPNSGSYYMPYGGEASISAKWWKDSVDDIRRPKFVEGETGIRQIQPDKMSQTGNIKKLRDQLSVGLVFQRADNIQELHKRTCDNIVEVTSEASALSKAYGQ